VVASSHALTQALSSFMDQILTMAMRYDATWFYTVIEFEQFLSHLSDCINHSKVFSLYLKAPGRMEDSFIS
jgi:hypothetical protein